MNDVSRFHKYTQDKPEASLDYPFGPEVCVYKVKGKMFSLFSKNKKGISCVNLKCDPDEAHALRDLFTGVLPGFHMNKKHWNTVLFDDSVPDSEIERMIDCSYGLVVSGLKKSDRHGLEIRHGTKVIYR